MNHVENLSARQLAVAVLMGGLSSAAACAGAMDWRWALVTVPAGAALGWLVLRRVGRRPLLTGAWGGVLAALYCGWAVVLMAEALRRAAERVHLAAEGGRNTAWLIVLFALPLLWMGWGKAAAFFRAVEIFWLAVLVMLAAIILLGAFRVDWRYVWTPVGSWWESVLRAGGILATGFFVTPYIYKVKENEDNVRRGLAWLSALGVLSAALCFLTAGMLSPAVSGQLEEPFFVAAGLLGDSARLESLISALWLLPDLTLVGLLSRVWGNRRWPAAAVVLAAAVALTGVTGNLPWWVMPAGSLVLGGLSLVAPVKEGKSMIPF